MNQERDTGAADGRSGAQPPAPAGSDIARRIDEAQTRLELADPDEGLPMFDRVINKSVEAVGIAALASVFGIILVSTLGRYFYNRPLIWGEEVVLGVIPWMVAIGMFLSVRRRHLVRVDFVARKLPPWAAQAVGLASQVLSIFVFAYIAWSAFRYVGFFGRDLTPYLGLPKGLSTSAFFFAGAATAVAFLIGVVRATVAGDWSQKGR